MKWLAIAFLCLFVGTTASAGPDQPADYGSDGKSPLERAIEAGENAAAAIADYIDRVGDEISFLSGEIYGEKDLVAAITGLAIAVAPDPGAVSTVAGAVAPTIISNGGDISSYSGTDAAIAGLNIAGSVAITGALSRAGVNPVTSSAIANAVTNTAVNVGIGISIVGSAAISAF